MAQRPLAGSTALLVLLAGVNAPSVLGGVPPPSGQEFRWYGKVEHAPLPVVGSGSIVEEVELRLGGDARGEWQRYEQATRGFFEWFKGEQERLERKYDQAVGEAKINAARALINFVVDAQKRWDQIRVPSTGVWEGELRIKTDVTVGRGLSALRLSGGGKARVRLEFSFLSGLGNLGPSRVSGKITDGQQRVVLKPIGMPDGAIPDEFRTFFDASCKFGGDVVGLAAGGEAQCIFGLRWGDMAGATPLGAMDLKRSGGASGRYFARYVTLLSYGEMILAAPPDESRAITLHLQPRMKDFDALELLIRYYVQYVKTIDTVRSQQYLREPPAQESKMRLALGTLELLLAASALGEALGIPLEIMDRVGLAYRDPASLYDKWFRMWFLAGCDFWDAQVQHSAGVARTAALLGRFNFICRAASFRELGILSENPFQDYGLSIPGPRLDAAYQPYYQAALADWLNAVERDPAQLPAALHWVEAQVLLVGSSVISEGLGAALGLTAVPPAAEQSLRRKAGP